MKKVIIYSKEGCGGCATAKSFMNAKNILYEVREVDKDDNAYKEMQDAGVMSLPYIKIGEKEIIGFKPNEILSALK